MRILFICLTALSLFTTAAAQNTNSVAKGNNLFAFKFYREVASKPDCFASPLSISSAVAMAYTGALGATREQIQQTFHYPADEELNTGYLNLMKALTRPLPNATVTIANKLWASNTRLRLDPAFVETNKTYYGAVPEPINFDDANTAAATINEWVAKKTNNKIPTLIQPDFISSTVLVLTNAIYFQSKWKRPFPSDMTHEGMFTTDTNTKTRVSYMHNVGTFLSYKDETVHMLELPYADGEFSFFVLLPIASMNDLESSLSLENLESWLMDAQMEQFGTVRIPKFKAECEIDLRPLLINMGMKDAFSPGAELEGIGKADGHIMLNKAVHKSFIVVNEEGTEAAAATAVGAVARGMTAKEGEFIADHPFIYMIRHIKTGTILFMGKVSNPVFK